MVCFYTVCEISLFNHLPFRLFKWHGSLWQDTLWLTKLPDFGLHTLSHLEWKICTQNIQCVSAERRFCTKVCSYNTGWFPVILCACPSVFHSGRKLYTLITVCFGLLCILQAALHISVCLCELLPATTATADVVFSLWVCVCVILEKSGSVDR